MRKIRIILIVILIAIVVTQHVPIIILIIIPIWRFGILITITMRKRRTLIIVAGIIIKRQIRVKKTLKERMRKRGEAVRKRRKKHGHKKTTSSQ